MSLEIKDFIFCDDIRIEIGNKFSLMGLYGDRVKVNLKEDVKVVNLPLSVLLRIQQPKISQREYGFDMKISFSNQEMAAVDGVFTFGDSMVATIPFVRLNFQFANSGELKFDLVVKDGEKKILEHRENLSIEIDKPAPPSPASNA